MKPLSIVLISTCLLISCKRDPGVQSVQPAKPIDSPVTTPAIVNPMDSITGRYNGKVEAWSDHHFFDTVTKNEWWTRTDTAYRGYMDITAKGKDSFIVTSSFGGGTFEYIAGARQYNSGDPNRGGALIVFYIATTKAPGPKASIQYSSNGIGQNGKGSGVSFGGVK